MNSIQNSTLSPLLCSQEEPISNNTCKNNTKDQLKNKSIEQYKITRHFNSPIEMSHYITAKIASIDCLEFLFTEEYGFKTLGKKVITGKQLSNPNINLADNCAEVSYALYNCFTDPQNSAFLDQEFRLCMVVINQSDGKLSLDHDSYSLTSLAKNIQTVYHSYLIIQHSCLSSYIIVDPTLSNYRNDQNLFVGSYAELLSATKDLLLEKKEHFKHKFCAGYSEYSNDILYINNWIYNNTGTPAKAALKLIHSWYHSFDIPKIINDAYYAS